MGLVLIAYIITAIFVVQLRTEGQIFRAEDALLSFSEISSCQLAGVQPGVGNSCPAAP